MKSHESGYPDAVPNRPATTETPSGASQVVRNVAGVVVVVVAVLALLVLGVLVEGDVVTVDSMPQLTQMK
jgi:hypothetical protein